MPLLATLLTLVLVNGDGGERPLLDSESPSTSAEAATSDKTSEETGKAGQPPKQDGRGVGALPELPLDVWREIWSKLSPSQLVRAAGVNREWRRECVGRRRDEAIALVTAPEALPDSDLSRPQQAWRGIQRILRRQNPFSGERLPHLQRGQKRRPFKFEVQSGADRFVLEYMRKEEAKTKRFLTHYSLLKECGSEGQGASEISFHTEWRPSSKALDLVIIYLYPNSPEDCTWMQGLLLALTGGFQGLLRDGLPSDMPGSLAQCKTFSIMWEGPSPPPKRLWPVRKARGASIWDTHFPDRQRPDDWDQSYGL